MTSSVLARFMCSLAWPSKTAAWSVKNFLKRPKKASLQQYVLQVDGNETGEKKIDGKCVRRPYKGYMTKEIKDRGRKPGRDSETGERETRI